MAGSVILAGARTPIGKLSGSLAGFEATDLGALAIRAALQRAGLTPEQVDYVFMGQVLLGGAGQMTARQASTKAGIPMSVPSTTVNKVCLSGLNAIHLADLYIQSGEADIVVAGGMAPASECMQQIGIVRMRGQQGTQAFKQYSIVLCQGRQRFHRGAGA